MKDTKSLLDEYFKTRPETTTVKIRGQIDRPELYSFETEIGKPLIDMDSQEIARMLIGFNNKSFSKKVYKISYRTYDILLSILRDFFNWYIDNYEVIKNPCNDKKIKGINVVSLFADSTEPFDKQAVEDTIKKIRESQTEENADYQEAIVRMFYEGFPDAIDIVKLKETDIDHKNKKAKVRERNIQLSDRLYELLVKINKMEEYPARRGTYLLLSYKGSFFKFPTRAKYKNEFNDRPAEYWAGHISRVFNREIKVKFDININARTIYLCGFYDYMVSKVGREKVDALITSVRNPEDTKTLMGFANEYGVTEKNVTILKKIMLPYVKGK